MSSGVTWLALLALAAWARVPSLVVLAAALVLALVTLALRARRRDWAAAGAVVLATGVLVSLIAAAQARRLDQTWPEYWSSREAQLATDLERGLDDLLDRSTTAASRLVAGADGQNLPSFTTLDAWREEFDLSALMLYEADGTLRLWAGQHRGRVPDAVQFGREPYLFHEVPLASYLYVTLPVRSGGTVVAASLLRSDEPIIGASDRDDLVSRFREVTGEQLRLSAPERARGGGVYEYVWEGAVLFTVSIDAPDPAVRRAQVLDRARFAVSLLVVLAWLLLGVAQAAQPRGASETALIGLALALMLPVLPAAPTLAAAGDGVLGVAGLEQGRLLRIAGITGALLLLLQLGIPRVSGRFRGVAVLGIPVTAALLLPLIPTLFSRLLSTPMLVEGEGLWWIDQLTRTAAVAGVLWVGATGWASLARGTASWPQVRVTAWKPLLAVLSVVALAGLATLGAAAQDPPKVFLLAGLALTLPALAERQRGRWAWSALIASVALLPFSWSQQIETRIQMATQRIERLGSGPDLQLEGHLRQLAVEALALDGFDPEPVELLYGAWRASGLAESGYPVWLTLWSQHAPPQDLRIGTRLVSRPINGPRPSASDSGEPRTVRVNSLDVHYLVEVPLADGRTLTGIVPPLGLGGSEVPLGPLFGSLGPGGVSPLEMAPLAPGDLAAMLESAGESTRWRRTPDGWQGTFVVDVAGVPHLGRYLIAQAGVLLLAAQAVLVVAFNMAMLMLLQLLALLFEGRGGVAVPARSLALNSFRARVTFALFAFFAISNLIFGSLAYRTITEASRRAAEVLAIQLVSEIDATPAEAVGSPVRPAMLSGADVLTFRKGELWEASIDELVQLGLYDGWLPYPVHRALEDRETLLETGEGRIGGWDHVVAFRRLGDAEVVGAPVPLQAGATALRSGEVAALLTAAVLLGAGLSLLLALLVGRALTSPIESLRLASERVGRGDLAVRLAPTRGDEFGTVFEAFNRMVERLGITRAELLRTSRRTEAIVNDAATGVVAFDTEGRVTIANARARGLLGLALDVGSIPGDEIGRGSADEFVSWMQSGFGAAEVEAVTEVVRAARRLRVRARRIGPEGEFSGSVVIIEDVTDELRSERILAWGEMARQVAHEVKNPLTPIKLSVQHLLRAWTDTRSDFGDILQSNATAMLAEIDRLAGIATSFSRFGAPAPSSDLPLSAVSLPQVVNEVLTLYQSSDDPVRFRGQLPDDLPRVMARETEMKEVLVNLLENARAAVSNAGDVRVRASLQVDPDQAAWVSLEVVDNGSGIPADQLPRIFEPHFSTRSSGTGLGLAIVRRLVDSWGGQVEARSVPGTETTLRLLLVPETEAGKTHRYPAGSGTEAHDASSSMTSPPQDADPIGE